MPVQEDIGKYKRKDLRTPQNLTLLFNDIRNYLVGTLTGVTRDETIAQQIINLLFCKIYDEIEKEPEDQVSFRVGVDESEEEVQKRISHIFTQVKNDYSGIFNERDKIELDGKSLKYIVGQLQDYCLIEAERDAIRKAFEVFIGPALRGAEGQFFTPRNVIQMSIEILDPNPGDLIIDPACGSGGFLVIVLSYIWKKLEKMAYNKNWSEELFYRKINEIISQSFKGLDKDRFLTKVTKAYMAIVGNGKEGIYCENSLENPSNWHAVTQSHIGFNKFDALFTNPPFGSKIKVEGDEILSQFKLGYKWSKRDNDIFRTEELQENQPPQILFIERCLQLLKEGGKMAIVLPEGLLGNPTQEYIRKYILQNAKVLAVVDAPIETFLPNTSTKTCILFLEKGSPELTNYKIFMAIAEKCGHDSRDNIVYKINIHGDYILDQEGNKIIDDDFPLISKKYKEIHKNPLSKYDSRGFLISRSELRARSLIPRFYDPEIEKRLKELEEDYELVTIGELIENKTLTITNGRGVKKKFYGTGDIPYIRTSDISNWELNIDYLHSVSKEIYEKFKQDLQVNDILFVKDGGRLIGTTYLLSNTFDVECLIQSHFQIIRCEDIKKIHPYLLLYILNKPIVKKQVEANIVIQSTIPTIGERTRDIFLPIPKKQEKREELIQNIADILEERAKFLKKIEEISNTQL